MSDSLRPHGQYSMEFSRPEYWSRGSSQPRDGTQASCTAGGFFTSWVPREAHASWGKGKGRGQERWTCRLISKGSARYSIWFSWALIPEEMTVIDGKAPFLLTRSSGHVPISAPLNCYARASHQPRSPLPRCGPEMMLTPSSSSPNTSPEKAWCGHKWVTQWATCLAPARSQQS